MSYNRNDNDVVPMSDKLQQFMDEIDITFITSSRQITDWTLYGAPKKKEEVKLVVPKYDEKITAKLKKEMETSHMIWQSLIVHKACPMALSICKDSYLKAKEKYDASCPPLVCSIAHNVEVNEKVAVFCLAPIERNFSTPLVPSFATSVVVLEKENCSGAVSHCFTNVRHVEDVIVEDHKELKIFQQDNVVLKNDSVSESKTNEDVRFESFSLSFFKIPKLEYGDHCKLSEVIEDNDDFEVFPICNCIDVNMCCCSEEKFVSFDCKDKLKDFSFSFDSRVDFDGSSSFVSKTFIKDDDKTPIGGFDNRRNSSSFLSRGKALGEIFGGVSVQDLLLKGGGRLKRKPQIPVFYDTPFYFTHSLIYVDPIMRREADSGGSAWLYTNDILAFRPVQLQNSFGEGFRYLISLYEYWRVKKIKLKYDISGGNQPVIFTMHADNDPVDYSGAPYDILKSQSDRSGGRTDFFSAKGVRQGYFSVDALKMGSQGVVTPYLGKVDRGPERIFGISCVYIHPHGPCYCCVYPFFRLEYVIEWSHPRSRQLEGYELT